MDDGRYGKNDGFYHRLACFQLFGRLKTVVARRLRIGESGVSDGFFSRNFRRIRFSARRLQSGGRLLLRQTGIRNCRNRNRPSGAPTAVAAMQRFKAGRVVGLLLEVFAEASAECVPTPAFGKIGLRVKWRYHQAAGQPIPSCPVLLLLGVIVRAAGSRQIQPRSRYLDVQNWKCCPSFYLLGDGMIFQTASICPKAV